jgi:aryl-alcohol dehydrogenase-like predicted oxidoreductase
MKRRNFLCGVGSTALTLGTASNLTAVEPPITDDEKPAGLPQRVLGRTGAKLSIVGFPGLALRHYEQDECTAGLHKAFARGVNYFDVAPAYGQGDCEIKMGIGLRGLDRGKYFLSCKTKMRDKAGAEEELNRSLERLKTDHFDLYQLHCLKHPDEVKQALGKGGAMETILKAKEDGRIKHIGFSAHTTKGALAAFGGFDFDTCMFPFNFVEYYAIGFGKPVIELAKKKNVGLIAIKPVSRGLWPEGMERNPKWWYRPTKDLRETGLAMRFTLGLDGMVTGIPISFLDILDTVIEACGEDRPNTAVEDKEIQQLALTCRSVFRREEERVADNDLLQIPTYPDSPHETAVV